MSHTISRWNQTPLSVDVVARIVGSTLVVVAYFFILHVNMTLGVMMSVVGDAVSLPYFIKTKSWDVVIMISFLTSISLSKLL